jgi:DNA repair exonuclease SbcCD nuclease subunit
VINDEVRIVGCGHETAQEGRNLVEKFPPKSDDVFTIGLVHCTLDNFDSEEGKYLPTTKQTLMNKKYDYWAIGHIHKRASIDNKIYYPGSVQSINYKEVEKKGGNLIEIVDQDTPTVTFVEFSTIDWITLEISLDEGIKDKYDLIQRMKKEINEQIDMSQQVLLKIIFSGATQLYLELKDEHFINELMTTVMDHFPLIIDMRVKPEGLKPYVNYRDYISDKNILGYIDQTFNNPDQIIDKLIQDANFAGHLVSKEEKKDYAKAMLESIKDETFLRMVGMHHED